MNFLNRVENEKILKLQRRLYMVKATSISVILIALFGDLHPFHHGIFVAFVLVVNVILYLKYDADRLHEQLLELTKRDDHR